MLDVLITGEYYQNMVQALILKKLAKKLVPVVITIILILVGVFVLATHSFGFDREKLWYAHSHMEQTTYNRARGYKMSPNVEQGIFQVEDDTETTGSAHTPEDIPGDNETFVGESVDTTPSQDVIVGDDWISTIIACHRIMGANGLHYVLPGVDPNSFPVTYNGKTVTVRSDCSGYVSFVLYEYGLTQNPMLTDSANAPTELEKLGFIKVSEQDIQIGDIMVFQGHIHFYAGPGKAYNWGSAYSAENKYLGGVDPNTVDPIVGSNRQPESALSIWRVPVRTS